MSGDAPPPKSQISPSRPGLAFSDCGSSLANTYFPSTTAQSKVTVSTNYDGGDNGKGRAVQVLAVQTSALSADGPLVRQSPRGYSSRIDCEVKIAVARSDGSASIPDHKRKVQSHYASGLNHV